MGRTMSSSSFPPLLPFFLLLAVVSLFIGVNARTQSESSVDYTSAFVERKKSDANLSNDSSKSVTGLEVNDDDDKRDEGDGDGNGDAADEEEEEEEENASGDGEGEEGEDDEMEEEYEGEERDEYEDELKALAESHEAMSKNERKDEGKNSNVSSKASSSPRSESSDSKNFESQENVLEKQSDEDVTSNEAIIEEIPNKQEDKEVADLLKYKKEKNSHKIEEEDAHRKKKKRVPTVKKELSTQKEIILASNETQVPKSLVPSEETFNVLNEETEPVRRRNLEGKEHLQPEDERTQEVIPESEKMLDKRHKTSPWDLKPCTTKECMVKGEEERTLQELRDREGSEAKSSSKFRKRVPEEFDRWTGVHSHLATDSQTGLEDKRNYETNLVRQLPMDDSQKEGKKQRKKKKKKKKLRRSTTTTTELPISPSVTARVPMETDIETTTTAIQWHLLAEKWFGPSWQQDTHTESEDVAKIQYAVTSKPSTVSSPIQQLTNRQDATNDDKEADTEAPPLLLPKSPNLDGRTNLFQFGKPTGHRNVYDLEADHLGDYETPDRVFQRLRFGEMAPTSSRDFAYRKKHQEDYRDVDGPLEEGFAHNREYRPSNQDFAMTRNWPDIPLKYNRPWKGDTRPIPSRLADEWAWRQPPPPQPPSPYDFDFWPARGKTWQPIRNYWTPLGSEDVDESEIDRNWPVREPQQRWQWPRPPIRQRQRQRLRQRLRQEKEEENERLPYSPWELEGTDVWPMPAKPFQLEPPWSRIKDRIYEAAKPSTTTMTRLSSKSKVPLPKISMTTWNSLTSDPATWPYKSSGTKPWPKDENGNSYNPNADLVRKLGLDKDEDGIWPKEKPEKDYGVASDRRNPLEPIARNSSKEDEEASARKYKLPKDRSSFSIYDLRSKSTKDWTKSPNGDTVLPLESSNDDVNSWYRDDDPRRVWSPKDPFSGSVPELGSVDGWVMPADKSTWMPYRYELLNTYENNNEIDSWSGRPMNVNVWDRKDGLSRIDPNFADPWASRFGNDRWNKENYAMWDRKRSFEKGQPENVAGVQTNQIAVASDSSKTNDSKVVMENSKDDLSNPKSNNWNGSYERPGSWSARWKQFSYHRVTALPTSKPGTVSNSSSKAKNAFVAVSVLSEPKYLPSRNDIEDTSNNRNDPFERQLEDLRQRDFWSSKTNHVEESILSTSPTIESTTIEPTLTTMANSTFVAHRPEEELPKSATKEYEMHLRI
ncbi:hypothetical protein KPH14_002198 [Odynerus spinipes]|uniref:Uncharacterized protein n=1 Tax=Odynerus spinipes TaxID=1348599 RepID=A0AAD9RLB2_9HYME|nr:hypothetical protein KPH14_002198 [Odynerus spinipes]